MILYFVFLLFFPKEINYFTSSAHIIKNENLTCEKLKLGTSLEKYCLKLKDIDQLIFFKLAKMKKLKKPEKNFNPYLFLYKEDQQFYLESFVYLNINFKEAFPAIKDYNAYGSWVIENINKSRLNPNDEPFLKITGMSFEKENSIFKIFTSLDFIIKNNFVLSLYLTEYYEQEVAKQIRFKITKPTDITPDINGSFIFYEIPDTNFMILYFYGSTKLNWLLYNALPLKYLEVYTKEKIQIMYENIDYKIEEIKEKNLDKHPVASKNSLKKI